MRMVLAVAVLYASIGLSFSQNSDVLQSYRKELEANPRSSLAHYRIADIFVRQRNYQSAANEFREALNGDLEPKWTEFWSYLNLGWIFDVTGQHERAVTEYARAERLGDIGQAEEFAEYLMGHDPSANLPLPTGVYRVADGVIGPELIQKTEPSYSEEALLAALEGTVLVTGVIAEDGLARDMRVTRSLGLGLDEKAMDAVKEWRFSPGTYQGRPVAVFTNVSVDFRLPSKQSRWHLVRATFHAPDGASRPTFLNTKYPLGAGVGLNAIEEARIVAAVGRLATAMLSFEVDEHGFPVHFQVQNASAVVWGNEAITLMRGWRFMPGMKNGVPISVPCTLGFVWGSRNLGVSAQIRLSALTNPEPPPPSDVFSPPAPGVQRVPVGRRVQAANIVTRVLPEHPSLARQAHIEGTVLFSVLIGTDGLVQDLHVISGHPLLVPTAIDAVKKWVYRPTILNGNPVEVTTEVDVDFIIPTAAAKH
jgi:TonB family protein